MRYAKRMLVILAAFALLLNLSSDTVLQKGTIRASATTTQQKIDQTTQEKKDLENKLGDTQAGIENWKGEQKTLKGELGKLNSQLSEVSDHLADLEQQIVDKEQEIVDTQAALEEAKQTEADQYVDMVIRTRKMYEHRDASYTNAIIAAASDVTSFSEMLYTADGFEKIASYDRMMLEQFMENRELIEEHEALLQTEKVELERLKVEAETEKNKVSGLIGQTSGAISKYGDQIAEAEAQARAYEAEIKKKEEDLEYLRKKLAEEIAMSQAAAQAAWRDISEVQFAEGDRYLLANLIYCEAGGEPYEGQLAVGSVVINRVLSSKYPDTVVGVIYQNRQFSPVGSGRLELALATNRATARCYQAADEAMSGVTNVGNCVYFRTPVPGLTGINIGGHVFY